MPDYIKLASWLVREAPQDLPVELDSHDAEELGNLMRLAGVTVRAQGDRIAELESEVARLATELRDRDQEIAHLVKLLKYDGREPQ